MDWLDLLLTQKEFLSLFGVIRTPVFVVSHVSSLSAKPLFHLVGDDLGTIGGATVAGHDGATLDADGAILAVHHTLQHCETLGAETLDGGLHLYLVVVMDLRLEVDVIVHHHDGEVALGGR